MKKSEVAFNPVAPENSTIEREGFSDAGDGKIPKVYWGLAIAGVILVLFRLHAFEVPLEADECNYAYIGGRLLAGDRLYVDVWDHQPFGVFSLFAGVIAIFGDSPAVFRGMAIVFSLASLGLVFAIARRCGGHVAAVSAAFLFALASSDPGTGGDGCNREIYMGALILAAWYFALRSESGNGWMIFASGATLAIASSLKTIVAIHWVFLAGWIVVGCRYKTTTSPPWQSVLRSMALFLAGPLILWTATAAYFALTGRLQPFFDAVFLFNLSYSGQTEGFGMRFMQFFSPPRHPFLFESALPLWFGAIFAVVWFGFESIASRRREAFAILLLLLAGYVAVCLPGKFWPHYYYLLIPPMVIAVSVSIPQAISRLRKKLALRSPIWHGVSFLAVGLFPLWLLGTQYQHYLNQTPYGITFKRYNSRDFWSRAQGENVKRVTGPDDKIFVYSNDTCVYYYAQRRCASRYTMMTGLHQGYAGIEQRRATLLSELQKNRPRLILVLFDDELFEGWKVFLKRYYSEPIGWDFGDRNGQPIMFVVARKDQPVENIDWNWDRSQVGGW